MNDRAKYHVFCYEVWHRPPQINFITNVYENHPFLLVRNRIDCGADKEEFSRIFQSAEEILRGRILNKTYLIERYKFSCSPNLRAIYEELKEKGFTEIIFRKAGAKPIDGSLKREKQPSKIRYYFDSSEAIYEMSSSNSPALARSYK